jgi:probable HAF family extracellular repeat protein
MPARPFAGPMAIVTLLTAGALACGQDSQAPTTDPADRSTTPPAALGAAATYTVKDLGTLGGTAAEASAINDQGGVVGWSLLANGRSHAFLWRAGRMQDLGALAGGNSQALAINNSDMIVGSSTVASGARRAVRWQNGKLTNLGTLGGHNSVATAINDFGVVVGWSQTAAGKTHAFVYQNGAMKDLGTLGGDYSAATGINRAGKIVGASAIAAGGENHAFTWKNGTFKDLGTHGHLFGSSAEAINTKGQIAVVVGPFPDAEGEELDGTFSFIFYQDGWTSLGSWSPTTDHLAMNDNGIVVGWGEDETDDTSRERAWVASPGVLDLLPSLTPRQFNADHANGINSFGTVVGSSADATGDATAPSHAVLWRKQ